MKNTTVNTIHNYFTFSLRFCCFSSENNFSSILNKFQFIILKDMLIAQNKPKVHEIQHLILKSKINLYKKKEKLIIIIITTKCPCLTQSLKKYEKKKC